MFAAHAINTRNLITGCRAGGDGLLRVSPPRGRV